MPIFNKQFGVVLKFITLSTNKLSSFLKVSLFAYGVYINIGQINDHNFGIQSSTY